MRVGIDFGTTRIVVAAVDRGNYPVVSFDAPDGQAWDWFPSLVAVRGEERLFGWDAWAGQQDPEATIVRSIKRFLQDSGPGTQVHIAGQAMGMLELLSGLTAALRKALASASSLRIAPDEPLETMLGVPANANGNQRFMTVEAFRRGGFDVLGLLNEPSAASVEFGHAGRVKGERQTRDTILVYDLGGGTFDASLVETDDQMHTVVASESIPTLGGDDFDDVLADLALDAAAIPHEERDALSQAEVFRLHEECRLKKEALHANTRRVVIDLECVREGWLAVSIPVADFYGRCHPMVEETIHAVEDLLSGRPAPEAVYVTGGASELPLVSRALRESFGRRVRRSSYTRSATAIGLAIQADAQAGYLLREKFTRSFGVWREAECGHSIIFDPLFLKGTPLPAAGESPLEVVRRYYPVHNVGHFRYLECSHTSSGGRPTGEVMLWDEILFPFDAALQSAMDLSAVEVERAGWNLPQEIEERYVCDAGGSVTVVISNLAAGYHRDFRLGRWAVREEPIVPPKRKRRPAARKARQ